MRKGERKRRRRERGGKEVGKWTRDDEQDDQEKGEM